MDFRWWTTFGIIGAAAVLIILERAFPYDRRQHFFRAGLWNDLFFYSIIQNYILGIAISFIIEQVDHAANFSRLRLVSDWPLWTQFLLFFVTHDLYIYWFHRWQHRSKWLWRLHEAHHSTLEVDWLSGSRSHAFEILINQTIEFAPIFWFGGAPEVAVFKGIVDAVWGMYIHSNINVRSGAIQYFINGPEMHRWHHCSGDEKAYNKNFSTKLAVWDWLFGTAYFPKDRKPAAYGLTDAFPASYTKQLVFAFRKFKES